MKLKYSKSIFYFNGERIKRFIIRCPICPFEFNNKYSVYPLLFRLIFSEQGLYKDQNKAEFRCNNTICYFLQTLSC